MSLRKQLGALLASTLAPIMAEGGFRASGLAYFRSGPVTQFLLVELSPFATEHNLHFSVAIGSAPVTLPPRTPSMASLGATGAPIVQRPLAALSGRPATGYVIAPGADPTATGAALVSDVRAFALPWFAATATVDGLLAWLAADDLANASHANGYIAGLILAREGRRDEAREQFQHADGVRDVIVATARNLGIDL